MGWDQTQEEDNVTDFRRFVAVLLATAMISTLSLVALAYSQTVSKQCPTSGSGFTSRATVLNTQTHTKTGFVDAQYSYSGVQSRTKSWGYGFTGWQSATINSANPIQSASASCPV